MMKKITGNHILFLIVLLLLFSPLIQQYTSVVHIRALQGYMPAADTPSLGLKTWIGEEFQTRSEKYLKRKVGFHPAFVRLNNQLQYSFFGKVPASSMINGMDGHRFAPQYIDSYLGTDFIGTSVIREKVRKLSLVTDTLAKKGITLLVVMVPGKGFFHPEYFPESYQAMQRDTTNYEVYREQLEGTPVNLVDMIPYYLSLKESSPYVLYPRNAIHISQYGNYFIGDSLLSYIELKQGVKLPGMIMKGIELTDRPRGADKDVEDAMNLIINFREEHMAYPVLALDTTQAKPELDLLVIGDSFYFNLSSLMFSQAFKNQHFWFYYNEVYPRQTDGTLLNAKDLDLRKEIESRDVIMLYVNDAKLKHFAWGIIDDMYKLYFTD